jgi:hypothetical protein
VAAHAAPATHKTKTPTKNHEINKTTRLWAENGIREREFWTLDRLCVAYLQGTVPDESDMQWWWEQPAYKRTLWKELKDREYAAARLEGRMPRPFEKVLREHESAIDHEMGEFENLVQRFLAEIRQAFVQARPLGIDILTFDPPLRERAKQALTRALALAAIPQECLAGKGEA